MTGSGRGVGKAEREGSAGCGSGVVACQIPCDEIPPFSPAAASEVGRIGGVVIFFVFEEAKAEHLFDPAVEIEEGGADWKEDEDGKEVVEAGAQWSEVDEAAEEVVEGGGFVDVLGEECEEVVRKGNG